MPWNKPVIICSKGLKIRLIGWRNQRLQNCSKMYKLKLQSSTKSSRMSLRGKRWYSFQELKMKIKKSSLPTMLRRPVKTSSTSWSQKTERYYPNSCPTSKNKSIPRSQKSNLTSLRTSLQTGQLNRLRSLLIRKPETAMLSWKYLAQRRSSSSKSIRNSKLGGRKTKLS